MGTTLPKSDFMVGTTALRARNILRAIERAGDRFRFVAPSRYTEDVEKGDTLLGRSAVIEEMIERGLVSIEGERLDLTEAGRGLAWSKSKRYPLHLAQKQIELMLERVQAHNDNPDQLYFIDEIWLFGSAQRGEETVGDVDFAYSSSLNPKFDNSTAFAERRMQLRCEVPDHVDYYDVATWHLKQAVYGARRHPLLAGGQNGLDTLIDMAVPCRKIFDRADGGMVDEPNQARHPLSGARSERILEPLRMPEFTTPASEVMPSDSRWICAFRENGYVSARYERGRALGTIWLASPESTIESPWKAELLAGVDSSDPRTFGKLIWQSPDHEEPANFAAQFTKKIEHDSDGSVFTLRIESVDEWGDWEDDSAALGALGTVLADIAAMDVRRMLQRRDDHGRSGPITVHIEVTDPDSYMMLDLVSSLLDHLASHEKSGLNQRSADFVITQPEWTMELPWIENDSQIAPSGA